MSVRGTAHTNVAHEVEADSQHSNWLHPVALHAISPWFGLATVLAAQTNAAVPNGPSTSLHEYAMSQHVRSMQPAVVRGHAIVEGFAFGVKALPHV